jgi:dolichol-phosphate mannosyltransferase
MEIFKRHNIDGEVVVVDDCSPDGTSLIVKELSERHGNVHLIERPRKLGIGSAYKEGFLYSLSLDSDIIMEMDADFSHDPSVIPTFLLVMKEGFDLVVGSRYVDEGGITGWGFDRRFISRGANRLARSVLGLQTKDVTSGYRAYNRRVFTNINISDVKSDDFTFQVEMIMLCERAGLRICELPIVFSDRRLGESKLKLRDMWAFLTTILKLAL